MKSHLQDIVQHTHGLGFINLAKITGSGAETQLDAISEDKSVILKAKFKEPVPEFNCTFGMPNLGKLNTILNIPEYAEEAKITAVRKTNDQGESLLESVHFENKAGDFKNDYRFMKADIINTLMKTAQFKGVKWNVDIVPSVVSIQRLKFQASANSEETTFLAKTEDDNLKFYFGDHSSHAGNFVFQSNVSGKLNKAWAWPISQVISILSLAGDKTLKISDEGAMMITVDSGIADYNYIIPAQTK